MGIVFSKQYTQQAVTQALQILGSLEVNEVNLPNWASGNCFVCTEWPSNSAAMGPWGPWGNVKKLPSRASRGTQLKSNALKSVQICSIFDNRHVLSGSFTKKIVQEYRN